MKILILNCDEDENTATNGAELIKQYLSLSSDLAIDVISVFHPYTISDLSIYSGVIITGSRASVYEDKEWIASLLAIVRDLDQTAIPVLGICFGFQAVAQALGGKVAFSNSFEEGFQQIYLTDCGKTHSFFWNFPPTFLAYQSHGDIVTTLPSGAGILAENNFSIQAYSLRHFFCVQFHPEILPLIAKLMARRDGKDEKALISDVPLTYTLPTLIFENFFKEILKSDSK